MNSLPENFIPIQGDADSIPINQFLENVRQTDFIDVELARFSEVAPAILTAVSGLIERNIQSFGFDALVTSFKEHIAAAPLKDVLKNLNEKPINKLIYLLSLHIISEKIVEFSLKQHDKMKSAFEELESYASIIPRETLISLMLAKSDKKREIKYLSNMMNQVRILVKDLLISVFTDGGVEPMDISLLMKPNDLA